MSNYIVAGDELTDIADAIRAKSGGSGSLAFPAGFVSEIGNISTGGGLTLVDVLNRSVASDVVLTLTNAFPANATYMVAYNSLFRECSGLTSLVVNGLAHLPNWFASGTAIRSVSMPNVTICGSSAFNGCTHLETASFPALTTGFINYEEKSNSTFLGCTALTSVDVGTVERIGSNMFKNCASLPFLELKGASYINANAFNGAASLATIVIRSSSVPTLNNINAFANTPFASGKAGGTLYVPSSLISSYESATNWSTILGYSTNSIAAIEGSEYE